MQIAIEAKQFRTILRRNVLLPLGLLLLTGISFVVLILYLLNTSWWVDHTDQVISEAHQLLKASVDAETGLRGFLITGEREFLEPLLLARQERAERFQRLRHLVTDNPEQLRRVEEIRQEVAAWASYADVQIAARRRGTANPDLAVARQGKAITDRIRAGYDRIIATEHDLRVVRSNRARWAARWVLLLTSLISLAVGSVLAAFGRKQLMALSDRFTQSLRVQQDQNAELQSRSWVQASQTGLVDQLRGNLTIPEISARSLAFLARYVDAEVGRLYLSLESDELVASGSYAFDERQSTAAHRYLPGQGLVGQCARDGVPMYVSDVPENYLTLSSGMGQLTVSHLALVPLVHDGKVRGVLELGFRKLPTPMHRKALELAGERLGHAFVSSYYRKQTQDLLEETQRQAHELQSQQEELEANNEDLQQKSQELLAQQHHLEQSNAEMEQQQTMLEEQKERLERVNRELVTAQNEIRDKARGLETASRYKSEFLANMSHELRTPLNSILLLSNLLSENGKKSLTPEDVEYASTIHSSASDLLNLINDILDLSKVEAGKLDIQPESTSLAELAEALRRSFAQQMERKGLGFSIDIDRNAPATVVTDKVRTEQVLRNFLSNALKFTERGSVKLQVFAPQDQPGFVVGLRVQDTGIGIPPEKRDLIFEAFQQADGTISRRFGGTGLGLTISRELARLLHGKIDVQSVEGEGSGFVLYLPAAVSLSQTAPPRPERSTRPSFSPEDQAPLPSSRTDEGTHLVHGLEDDRARAEIGKAILIVEDDPAFAKLLFSLAKRKGYQCLLAPNGEQAVIDAARYLPLAIVLDLNLPGLSGLGVLESLKGNPRTRHIPVHVVSVESRGKDVMHRGAVAFDRKPVTEQGVEELLGRVASHNQTRNKRILLIEDNPIEQQNVRKLIGNGDIEIEAVSTGKEALEALEKSSFDCIILDLKLPDLSGFEVLAKAKDFHHKTPPVIIYTARDLTREEQQRLGELSDSVVLKGVRSPERLLDEVTLFLHKMEERLSPSQRDLLQKVRHREDVFQNKGILLVDDDMRNVFALRSVLLRKGFQVHIARTGQEALARLSEFPDMDAVLMDIMMPEMDGYEAMRRIRSDERFKSMPIVALTAKAMKGDREKCMQAGASDYLPKPVDVNSLLALLRIWLTR